MNIKNTCKICKSESVKIFDKKVLNKYQVNYFQCSNCDFVQTEEPYWLKEAYTSPINIEDTGIMKRNVFLSPVVTNIIYHYFDHKKKFLDYAGGYGFLVRLMRDIGINFKWKDDYTTNLVARGFEYSDTDKEIELVTAFEVFEHFVDPLNEIEKILNVSKNVLFSTEIIPIDQDHLQTWWYLGLTHGQHISFYSQKSLSILAKKFGLNYYSNNRNIHLFTTAKINPFFFKIIVNKRFCFLFFIWTALHLKTKTQSDNLFVRPK